MAALPPTVVLPIKQQCRAYVSFVETPEEVWIQLADDETKLSELMSNLNADGPLLPPVKGPVTGRELYAAVYTGDQRLYRVVVTGQQSNGVYVVHFVDYGNFELKRADELRTLDARFAALPRQAVRCHLDGVSTSATAELQALVLDKPVGVTALAQSHATGSYSVDIVAEDVGSVLAELRSRYPVSQLTRFAQPLDLPVGREEDVLLLLLLCDAGGGGLVCFRLQRFAQALDDLMAELAVVPLTRLPLKCGCPCVAAYGGRRYRAVVAEVRDGMQVLVRLVDYGREFVVGDDDLYVVPSQFFELPAQAMLCRPAAPLAALPCSPCPASLRIVGSDRGLPVASLQLNQSRLPASGGCAAVADSLLQAPLPPAVPSLESTAKDRDASAAVPACTIPRQMLAVGQVVHCFVTLVANPNYVAAQTADCDPARLQQLQMAVNAHCNSQQARPLDQQLACTGAVCAVCFTDDRLWYRGRLKSVERDARGAPVAADVLLVDFGNLQQRCPIGELVELPPELAIALPEQAILLEFQMPICVPVADFLTAFGSASEIVVQVVALRGNMTVARLTRDPENDAVRGVFAGDPGAGPPAAPASLGHGGSQKANQQQASSHVGSVGGGKIGFGPAVPPGSRQQQPGRRAYGEPRLPPVDRRVDVAVTDCEQPFCFFVYLREHEPDLTRVVQAIESHMEGDARNDISGWSAAPAPGMPCLAQSNTDWRWHRARIEEVVPKGQLKVYFVDYGSSEIVSLSKIADLPPKLLQVPPLAIECRLTGIFVPDELFESAVIEFRSLLSQPPIQMIVRSAAPQSGPIPVSLFVANGSSSAPNAYSSVSELLVQAGLGDRISHSPNVGSGEPSAATASTAISGGLGGDANKGNVGSSKPAFSRLGYKPVQLPQPSTTLTANCVYVEKPSSFWCQLLLSEVDVKRLGDEMAKLNEGGASALPSVAGTPHVGQPCCARFSVDGQWYRARVRESSGGKCWVDFVDYGNSEWVNFPHDLRQLPSSLLAIAPLAVHCGMAASGRRGAAAALLSTSWTADQCQEFEKTVLYQSLELEVFGVDADSILLVDVIAPSGRVSELLKSAGGSNVAAPVQRSRSDDGRTAPTHQAPEPTVRRDQPLAVAIDGGRSQPTSTATIASQAVAAGVRERVRVVWIIAPDHFYCHRESSEKLLLQISRGVDAAVKAGQQLRRPAPGTLCVACYSLDGQWYRALIKAFSTASCSLYFVDYGNSANAAGNSPLLEIDPRLAEIPPQAINCKLRGIAPRSLKGEWGDDARNKMELLISRGELYATFVAGHRDFNLVDLTLADGTSVADELVAACVAKPLRGDVPLGGSQTHSGSHSPSAGAADAGGPRVSAGGDGLLLSGEQPSPRRSMAASQSGFSSVSVRQDAGHGQLAGRPDFDLAPAAATLSGGRYRSPGAGTATGPAASSMWGAGPGSPSAASNSSAGASSWSDAAAANRKGGMQHNHSGNFRPPSRNDRGGPPRTTGRRDYGGNDAEDVSPRSRLGGPEGRSPFDRQAEATVGDGGQRPGRSYRRPVERFGQQPRRPREAASQQKQEQSSELVADGDEAGDGRLPAGAWQQGANRPKAKEGQLGQSDDWLEESERSATTVAQRVTISSSYRRTDLTAGSAYAAFLAYMPHQPVSDDAGSSLLIWIQLRQNEALVESVQEAVRQCTSETNAKNAAAALSSEPGVGAPCLAVYSADSAWYRAITTTAINKSAGTVNVHFVDYGNTDTVPVSQLREIPSALLESAPPLAIGCKVADADKLMDGLSEVTADAVREKLECHTLMVTFSESVSGYDGRGLLPCHLALLDESESQAAEDTVIVDAACAAVGAVQLADVVAVDHPEMKGQPGDVDDDVTIIVGYSPAELQPGVQYRATLAAYGTSPDEFWLHLERDTEAMTNLTAEIVHYVGESTSDEAAFVSAQAAVGASCLAKYSADGLWYRAEVTLLHPDTATVELLYVDYGNTDIVQWPSRSVMQLPAKLGQLPCLAVLCSLASDSPATLQDFESETADCIVAVFCSTPADHRKAALCTLLPPCPRDPAEDDEAGTAQVQAIIVNDEEEELTEEATESTQHKEEEGQNLENVTEPTLANVSVPDTVESSDPLPNGDEESNDAAASSEAAGADVLLPILPDCSERATRIQCTLSAAAHLQSATEADLLVNWASLTHKASDVAASSSEASRDGAASLRALSPARNLSPERDTVGRLAEVTSCEQPESTSFMEADSRQGQPSDHVAQQPQLADEGLLSSSPGVASRADGVVDGSGEDATCFMLPAATDDHASECRHKSVGLPAAVSMQYGDVPSSDFAERSDPDDDITIYEDLSLVSATCGPSTSLGADEPALVSAVLEAGSLADAVAVAAPDDSITSAVDLGSLSDVPDANWPNECPVSDTTSSFGPTSVDAITRLASDRADDTQDLCRGNTAAGGGSHRDGELECSPAGEALERQWLGVGPTEEIRCDGHDVGNFSSTEDLSDDIGLLGPSEALCTEAVEAGAYERTAVVGMPQPDENAATDAVLCAGFGLENGVESTSLVIEGATDSSSDSHRIARSGLWATTRGNVGCDSTAVVWAPGSDQNELAAANVDPLLKSDVVEGTAGCPALLERSSDDRPTPTTQDGCGDLNNGVNVEEIEARSDLIAPVLDCSTAAIVGSEAGEPSGGVKAHSCAEKGGPQLVADRAIEERSTMLLPGEA